MRDGEIGRWSCAAAHMLNRVIKSTMKKVGKNSSVDLLPKGLEGSVKFNPALQKKMKGRRKRGIKKINDYPETRCGVTSTCEPRTS